MQLTLSAGREAADREHRELVEICRRGDVEGAAKALYDHIMHACDSLLEHLPVHRLR